MEPQPGLTWYRPSSLFQSIDKPVEGRALQLFCDTAAPSLAGPLDSYFWTHLVLQFSNFEPSVRHSLVAISSLYEDFHYKGKAARQLQSNAFALQHYNAAIESLRKLDNEPLILLVCVLFVCIETLQNNRAAAMQHIAHGIVILERIGGAYPWTMEYLSPIFRRLSIFPLFFGGPNNNFPSMSGLEARIPQSFTTFAEAQYHMDGIVCRASRFIRQGDAYRYGQHVSDPVDPDLLAYQLKLKQAIDDWHASFSKLAKSLDLSEYRDMACSTVMSRYRISRLWALAAFEKREVFYDDYISDLKEAVDQAVDHGNRERDKLASRARPRFTFETGFLPMVLFSVMRCRDLRTRLKGLGWLRDCGSGRENMWEAEQMYPVCRRLVEIEHDIVLDQHNQPIGQVDWDVLPPEESRSKDFGSSPTLVCQKDADGREVWGRLASYAMRTADGVVWTRKEFIPWPIRSPDVQVGRMAIR